MSQRYGPYTERELAEKLAKVPDAEIQAFNRKRIWRSRYYYLAGLVCGLIAIPFIILNNYIVIIIVGLIGITFVQYGRLQRHRWQQTFQTLMQIRSKPPPPPDGKTRGASWKGKRK